MTSGILFVDDEFAPDTDTHYGSYMPFYDIALRESKCVVETAKGSDEALALFDKDRRFDLAILDVMMPPGVAFQGEDTRKGLITGTFLARKLHKIDGKMPSSSSRMPGETRNCSPIFCTTK